MLSKELKELELNGMIVRNVYDSTLVTVEYKLSESGKSITEVLDKMIEWVYNIEYLCSQNQALRL